MATCRFVFTLILSLLLVVGCADQKQKEESQISHGNTFAVVALDSASKETAAPYSDSHLFAAFPLIRGALSGNPNTKPVLLLPTSFGKPMTIPMDELSRLVEPLALAPTPEMVQSGLTVMPETTRIARIGTFFLRKGRDDYASGAKFIDKATRENMSLIYVDRPCKIVGIHVYREAQKQYKYDLAFTTPGLHWVRIKQIDSSNWDIRNEQGSPPMLFSPTENK